MYFVLVMYIAFAFSLNKSCWHLHKLTAKVLHENCLVGQHYTLPLVFSARMKQSYKCQTTLWSTDTSIPKQQASFSRVIFSQLILVFTILNVGIFISQSHYLFTAIKLLEYDHCPRRGGKVHYSVLSRFHQYLSLCPVRKLSRILHGSWVQKCFWAVSPTPCFWGTDSSLHDLPWVLMDRFKQLLTGEDKGCKTREEELRNNSAALGQDPGSDSSQFSSVPQPCPTLSDLMNCSTPDFSVDHQLLELAQTHVHQVSDAIQPSHPLPSPSPPALNLSQHQGLFW